MISSQQARDYLQQQLSDIKDKLLVYMMEAVERAFTVGPTVEQEPELVLTWKWARQAVSSFDEFLESRVQAQEDESRQKTVREHLATLTPKNLEEFIRSSELFVAPAPDSVSPEFYSSVLSGDKKLLMAKTSKQLKVNEGLRALAQVEMREGIDRPEISAYLPDPLMVKSPDIEFFLTVTNSVLGFSFFDFPSLQRKSESLRSYTVPVLPQLPKHVPELDPTFFSESLGLITRLTETELEAINRERLQTVLEKEEALRTQFIKESEVRDYNASAFSELIELI